MLFHYPYLLWMMKFVFCSGILQHFVYWEAKKYINSAAEKGCIVFIPEIRTKDADMARIVRPAWYEILLMNLAAAEKYIGKKLF